MNRYFILLVLIINIFSFFQIEAGDFFVENGAITEFVVFKTRDPLKGAGLAHSMIEDIKAFNDGIIAAEVYQSVNDPHTIAQRITWKSLKKAQDAFAAFDTFPSASNFSEQSGNVIFFDHFRLIKPVP